MADKKQNLQDQTKIHAPELNSKEYETIVQENEVEGSANSAEIILNNSLDKFEFKQENHQQLEEKKLQETQEELNQKQEKNNINNLTIDQRLEKGQQLKLLGNQQLKTKNYQETIKIYEEAIELVNPIHFIESSEDQKTKMIELINALLNNLGYCQMQINQFETAMTNFNQILVSNPNNIKAHYRLAISYKKLQNYQMAYKHIQLTYDLSLKINQIWNDLIKEMEEIKQLCNEEKIDNKLDENKLKNLKDQPLINTQKNIYMHQLFIGLGIFNSNIKQDLLLFAVPSFLTSTVFTKYVMNLDISNKKGILLNASIGSSIFFALKLKKPSMKLLFGALGSGIVGSCLMKKYIF